MKTFFYYILTFALLLLIQRKALCCDKGTEGAKIAWAAIKSKITLLEGAELTALQAELTTLNTHICDLHRKADLALAIVSGHNTKSAYSAYGSLPISPRDETLELFPMSSSGCNAIANRLRIELFSTRETIEDTAAKRKIRTVNILELEARAVVLAAKGY